MMIKEEGSTKTSESFWYRLINVLYGIGWLGVLIAAGIAFVITKPYQYLDDNKSYVTCLSNNGQYTYSKIQEYIYKIPNWTQLNLNTIEDKAQYICERVIEDNLKYRASTDQILQYLGAKGEVFSEYDQKWYQNTAENRKIIVSNIKNQSSQGTYKINEINSTRGSWWNVALWVTGVFIVLVIVLDLLKGVLLYLAVGRRIHLKDFTFVKFLGEIEFENQ